MRERVSEAKLDELERVSLTPHRAMQLPTMDVRAMVDELRAHRAAALTAEERGALAPILDPLEYLYARARTEAIVNGDPDPKREKIERAIAVLAKLSGKDSK